MLIRTTGLWGSSFSRALTHKSPDIKKTFLKGAFLCLQNLFFFTPRRKVLIEIEANPKDFPYTANRIDMNRYLEKWYNQYLTEENKRVEEEPLTKVSYSFLAKIYPKVAPKQKKEKKITDAELAPEKKEEIFKELLKMSHAS